MASRIKNTTGASQESQGFKLSVASSALTTPTCFSSSESHIRLMWHRIINSRRSDSRHEKDWQYLLHTIKTIRISSKIRRNGTWLHLRRITAADYMEGMGDIN